MTSATKLPTVPEAVGDHKEDELDSYPGIAEYFGRHRSSCQRQKTAEITTCFPRRPRRRGEMLKSMQFLKELENVVREKHQG